MKLDLNECEKIVGTLKADCNSEDLSMITWWVSSNVSDKESFLDPTHRASFLQQCRIIKALFRKDWNLVSEAFQQLIKEPNLPVNRLLFQVAIKMALEAYKLAFSVRDREKFMANNKTPQPEFLAFLKTLKMLSTNGFFTDLPDPIEEFLLHLTKYSYEGGIEPIPSLSIFLIRELGIKPSEKILEEVRRLPNTGDTREEMELWVESLNILGKAPIHRMAKIIICEELSELLAKQGILNPPFMPFFEETQSRILLAHIWGVGGLSRLGEYQFKVDGSQPRLMRAELKKSVQNFTENHIKKEWVEASSQKIDLLTENEIIDILNKAKRDVLRMQPVIKDMFPGEEQKELMDVFPKDVIMFLPRSSAGDGNHAVGIGIYKEYCYLINRGYGAGDFSGATIYQFADPAKLMAVTKYVDSFSNVNEISAYIQTHGKPVNKFQMKPQLSDNCGWIAAKGNYLGAVYFQTLEALKEKGLPLQEMHKIAEVLSKTFYKYYSTYHRQSSLEIYQTKETDVEKDERLLAKVCMKARLKMLRPEWQMRGGKPLLPLFSPQMIIQSNAELETELERVFFLDDIKKMDLILRQNVIDKKILTKYLGKTIFIPDYKKFELLLAHGAEVNVNNGNGEASFLFAAMSSLISNGENKENFEQNFQILEAMLKAGAKDPDREPPALFEALLQISKKPLLPELRERISALIKQHEKSQKKSCVIL